MEKGVMVRINGQIFKVLYSPFRAFEEIVREPKVGGPFLILALTLLATVGAQYVGASKVFLETGTPGEYICLLSTGEFSGIIISSLMNTALSFFLNWILYAGILLLIIKLFREQAGPWQGLFIIVGYVFSVTLVHVLASALLISTLPTLPPLPLKVWPPATEDEAKAVHDIINKTWYPTLAYQLESYLTYAIDIWTTALIIIAIRYSHKLAWRKAATISAIAYVVNFLLRTFIT